MRLDSQRTFASIVVGSSNELAVTLARRVVGRWRDRPNPLLILGPPGTGKTHLLQAAANERLRRHPFSRLEFLTAEEYACRLIESIRLARTRDLCDALTKKCDGLFVDDLDFLIGKDATQCMLRASVRCLVESGKPVVLASSRCRGGIESLATDRVTGTLVSVRMPTVRERSIALVRSLRLRGEHLSRLATHDLARRTPSVPEARGALHRLLLERDLACAAAT